MKPLFGEPQTTFKPAGVPVAQPLVVQQASLPAVVPQRQLATLNDFEKLGGANEQRIGQTTQKILESVKASDTDAFGSKLNDLIATAKKMDPNKMQQGFFGKLFGMGGNIKERLFAEYQSVQGRMQTLINELDSTAALMRQRVVDCESMFVENERSYTSLKADVAQGQAWVEDLKAYRASLPAPNDGFEAQHISDLEALISMAEKRIDDLERGMQLALIAAPEIRIQQAHNRSLAQSIADIKVTTIPAWQGVFSRYILSLESKRAAAILTGVQDATEEAFRMQADQLRSNATEIATLQQRSVVSIETLSHMQTQLIGAIEDTKRIAEEGRQRRIADKPKLLQLERDLIQRFSPTNRSN